MKYPSIKNIFNRDPDTNYQTLIEGEWAREEFHMLRHVDWMWQEKIDGTNIRIIWDGENVEFRGRTDAANLHPGLKEYLEEEYTPDRLAPALTGPVTLYGEGYGEKIQSGGGYTEGQKFILFDIRAGDVWLHRETVGKIASQADIPHVPIVNFGTPSEAVAMVRQGFPSLLKSADPDKQAEGLVIRPPVSVLDRMGNRVIAKVKTCDFPDG